MTSRPSLQYAAVPPLASSSHASAMLTLPVLYLRLLVVGGVVARTCRNAALRTMAIQPQRDYRDMGRPVTRVIWPLPARAIFTEYERRRC